MKKNKAFSVSADNHCSNFIFGEFSMTISTGNIAKDEDSGRDQTVTPQQRPVSVRTRFAAWFFTPALAPIMQQRSFLIILAGFAFVQIGLTSAGWQGWQCPIYFVSGMPCPGCGLSRAMALFIQGHWHAAFDMHAFAPILLIAVMFFAVTAAMPRRLQQTVLLRVAVVERRTGIMIIVMVAIFMYWGLRIAGVINSTLP
jgi:hypothetical protein